MKPTSHIRFVSRIEIISEDIGREVRVLQQWWAFDPDCFDDFVLQVNGEWRDVPLAPL